VGIVSGHWHVFRHHKREGKVGLQHLPHFFNAKVSDKILDAGPLAVGTVAVIPVKLHYSLGGIQQLLPSAMKYAVTQVSKGVGAAMGPAHPATHKHIVTSDFTIIYIRKQTEILCKDVDAIVIWQRETGFEFAWQVNLPIYGFDIFGGGSR
jgi:hypothetical protein